LTASKRIAAIVVAAGRGERASANGETIPKQYRMLGGVPVLTRTINALLAVEAIRYVLPVIRSEHGARYAGLGISDARVLRPVVGGAQRQESVLEGLKALATLQPDLEMARWSRA
jgi:2-C-methyl-D-erythritol 4-phosphate cytidylyltransferase/2-C-methyl-D-erythritol 2,4-cyclodiphosphate synthase